MTVRLCVAATLVSLLTAIPAAAVLTAPTAGSSDGGLLLDRGVFRPLPDVPGATQTVHFRNNHRGEIAGTYADDSDGTARLRGFLMRNGRVIRIDVPGALPRCRRGSTTAARS